MTDRARPDPATIAIRILLVEDNPGDARLLREELADSKTAFEIRHVARLDESLVSLTQFPVDLVLLDLNLPDSSGFETFIRMQSHADGIPVVVLSGLKDEDIGVQSVQSGAQDYLVKGQIPPGLLERTIRYALERARSSAEVRKSEERYREFFDEDLAGAFIASAEGKMLACNPALARMFGYASVGDALDRSVGSYFPTIGEAYAMLERIRVEKKLLNHEFTLRRVDGKPVHTIGNLIGAFDAAGTLYEIKGYLVDDSERRQLEEELRQSQKMESIGRLAGGVAHDFNNLLTVILGYTDALLEDAAPDAPHRADLTEIQNAGERAAALTRQLLTFSRRQVLQPRLLDLSDLVARVQGMLERLLGDDIEVVARLDAGVGLIRADASQIEQVVLNLCVNARDAMPGGGTLTIETRRVRVDGSPGSPARVGPGNYAVLSVSDTGHGIEPDVLPKLFEPFFTTKKLGEGTGLGLSTVYGTVKQSNGDITVETAVGIGSVFRVYLPVIEEATVADATTPAPVERVVGSETILLVEDEEGVRRITSRLLQARGYEVLEAADGLEAIGICERHEGTIDLLITDMMMPRMNGRDLSLRIQTLRPDIRVLFVSGYTADSQIRAEIEQAGKAFLQKPVAQSLFQDTVRHLLDTRRQRFVTTPAA
ncbi:MAG: response regulator [Acidobacteriota bacterium]